MFRPLKKYPSHDTAPLLYVRNVSAIFYTTFVVFHYGSLPYAVLLSKCYFKIEFLSVKKNGNFQQKNAFFTMVQRKYKLHPHLHLKVSIAQKDCQFFPARFQHCFASQIFIYINSTIFFFSYSFSIVVASCFFSYFLLHMF
jgi:hypothetical protein